MIDATVRAYATRTAFSVAMALLVVVPLLLVGSTDARQSSASPRGFATLTGLAHAIDGDTLLVGGIRVRLEGIDAPETEQTCTTAQGQVWPCGLQAQRILARLVAHDVVHCEERGLDIYKRLLGICRIGGHDINAELVRQGLAWAFVRYSQSYVAIEAEARTAKRGIWSGTAQPPWDYRTAKWQVADSEPASPQGCPIKGNVTAHGRIYHLPWSPWYGRIKMDGSKGKRWFCSESEAMAAGWRAAALN